MRVSSWANVLLAAAAFALVGTLPGSSQADFLDGWAAYDRGDLAGAFREWRRLAERGDASAQTNLGFMYENGHGVPQDDTEAAKWYRLAAEQGVVEAQYNLGAMYDDGHGVPQDDAEALKWYRKAARQGHPKAQANLGFMYGEGRGIPQDYVQAHKWYNLAASRFAPGEDRDLTVKSRDSLATFMTPAQVAEAQQLARNWKPKTQAAAAPPSGTDWWAEFQKMQQVGRVQKNLSWHSATTLGRVTGS